MRTLSRYISKKFVLAITAVFILCFALIFLVDLIEMMREAIKRGGTVYDAMLISAFRVPSFTEMSLPFAVLIGSIGAFLMLSKNSELIVARSAGMSIWQFARPALVVGLLSGAFVTAVYNPVASWARTYSENLQAALVQNKKALITTSQPIWLRQDGPDGPTVVTAEHVASLGAVLSEVIFFVFDRDNQFKERIDARSATLEEGRWELADAVVTADNEPARQYGHYIVGTYLTRAQVEDSIGLAETVPFWNLPEYIEVAEKAGLPATQYKMQLQTLLSRPLWMLAMVLLAATCSLKPFRFGNVQKMILYGLVAGFGFFVFAQISRNMGLSGHTSAILSAWGPAVVACLLALTVLMHQEDG
jgi:lipopolysaccharide export system permease protein